MRNLAIALSLTAVLGFASIGCSGADTSADDESEETIGDAEGALTARNHYVPGSIDLHWVPGCGMRLPEGGVCYMGLQLEFMKSYKDLSVSVRTSVNNSKDTLTVKLDTYSTNAHHILAPVSVETKDLGTPQRMSFGKTYHAKVVDWQNHVLWSGDIVAMPAA